MLGMALLFQKQVSLIRHSFFVFVYLFYIRKLKWSEGKIGWLGLAITLNL